MSHAPPRYAERVLEWCLRSAPSSAYIVGDLRQEYAAVRSRRGALLAHLWYGREVLAVGARYVGRGAEASGGSSFWRELPGDVASALRVFRASPGFSVAVILTLALGLGVNATMFGAVDRVLLSPPEHVQDHEELRFLYHTGLLTWSVDVPMAYTFPGYEAIRELPVLAGAAAYQPRSTVTMGTGLDARRPTVQNATAEFFPVLGVVPALGRFFDVQDDREGAPPVAVLGHGFWEREFGGDPAVVGQLITLGSHSYEVIGVAPSGFTGATIESIDVWVPLRMNIPLTAGWDVLSSYGSAWFRVVVRLAEGISDDDAGTRLTEAHTADVLAYLEGGGEPHRNLEGATIHTGAFMTALGPMADSETSMTLWLAGVSLLVLLISCANVANLMLARGIERRQDRAVRLAFGVSRRRLVSQALAEALLLSTAGGLAAVLVARWSGRALYGLLLPGIPQPDAAVSLRLIAFLGVIVVFTTVVAGVLPAFQALRTAPGDVLRSTGRGSTGSGGRVREGLTLAQVTLSTVLLVGAGLFVQSLRNALVVDPGFDNDVLLSVEIEPRPGVDADGRDVLYREALQSLEAMPGVERVSLSTTARPLYGWNTQSRMVPSGMDSIPRMADGGPYTYYGTDGFVDAAGLRVYQGRAFDPAEYGTGGPLVVMVSRSFAEGAWPGLDPLRECVTLANGIPRLEGPEPCRPVVGVYEDLITSSLEDRGRWSLFWPLPPETTGYRGMLVRANGDATELAQPIRDRLAALSSDVRYVFAVPMSNRTESMRGSWRVGATLFSVFGLLALVVATLGLYSVLAFAVARRRREIGIRGALGAQRRDLVGMVVARVAKLVAVGLVLGLGIAGFAGRFLEAALFGVPTVNPLVFGVVALVLAAAGLLAAWVPAVRATSIDPVGAMAAE